jgi:peptidyl-prolyl cis-trans isomerase B (cyclophilin B)
MSNTRRPSGSSSQSPQSTPRATQVVVAVVALLCVVAVSAIAAALHGKGGTTPAATGGISTAPSSPAPSTAASSAPAGRLHCTQAPAPNPKPQSFKSAPSAALAQHATWVASIVTNCGDIRMQLDGKAAPQTVASFVFLARKGFFDKSPCQRLTTSGLYVLQCGDPTGTGTGGPGYGFGIENAPKQGAYPAGTVAMARTASPTSNGSQFFVVYQDTALPTQGGGYSIFGKVTKGLGIVKALAQTGVTGGGADGAPAQPISILHVHVKKA